jgi:hypothetical protein
MRLERRLTEVGPRSNGSSLAMRVALALLLAVPARSQAPTPVVPAARVGRRT